MNGDYAFDGIDLGVRQTLSFGQYGGDGINVDKMYKNAVEQPRSFNKDWWAYEGLCVGGGYGKSAIDPRGATGEACCIRVYSRVLSQAEIAHNYEIDKKRFGT